MKISDIGFRLAKRMVRVASMAQEVQAAARSTAVSKSDASPITIADLAVQIAVTSMLSDELGSFRLVGEENSDILRQPGSEGLAESVITALHTVDVRLSVKQALDILDLGRFEPGPADSYWVLDPIDGTKGFLRGDQYAIALAEIHEGSVTKGILACPMLNVCGRQGGYAIAERGSGSWVLDESGHLVPIGVSSTVSAENARFCESVESGHSSHEWSKRVAEELGIDNEPLRLDSQAKYLALAAGQADIYLRLPVRGDYVEKVWDHAAGSIIVEEAGGVVSDCRGVPLDFVGTRVLCNNSGVVVATPGLHARVIEAIKAGRPKAGH